MESEIKMPQIDQMFYEIDQRINNHKIRELIRKRSEQSVATFSFCP